MEIDLSIHLRVSLHFTHEFSQDLAGFGGTNAAVRAGGQEQISTDTPTCCPFERHAGRRGLEVLPCSGVQRIPSAIPGRGEITYPVWRRSQLARAGLVCQSSNSTGIFPGISG